MAGARHSLVGRYMALQNKVFDRLRHRRAFEAARQEGTAPGFDHFRGARQCVVVTFRRSGEPVPTPVNFGLTDAGTLIFRTEDGTGKLKRLRRDPHVRVFPCSLRGKPLGATVEGTARVLPDAERERADAALAANWRPEVKVLERGYDRVGVASVYVEVTPAAVR
ncbi:MAG TPA: PPOX class F420-dependent oxidoreductase [Solirubrobacteraceae bacterium]|nr:PPOX class F420-dependent oxidoreductase [Solirubrobacteraceae bacterium]